MGIFLMEPRYYYGSDSTNYYKVSINEIKCIDKHPNHLALQLSLCTFQCLR